MTHNVTGRNEVRDNRKRWSAGKPIGESSVVLAA